MPVVYWVLYAIIALAIFLVSFLLGSQTYNEKLGATIGAVIGIVIDVIILFTMLWWFSHTASGARELKTEQSNFDKGINRQVTVYDVNGDVIQQYRGKFDIEYDDDRILFDDEKGMRHIIYYPTGTVIVDEID